MGSKIHSIHSDYVIPDNLWILYTGQGGYVLLGHDAEVDVIPRANCRLLSDMCHLSDYTEEEHIQSRTLGR